MSTMRDNIGYVNCLSCGKAVRIRNSVAIGDGYYLCDSCHEDTKGKE